jgi:hypothetical protein
MIKIEGKIIQIFGEGWEINVLTNEGKIYHRTWYEDKRGYGYEWTEIPQIDTNTPPKEDDVKI